MTENDDEPTWGAAYEPGPPQQSLPVVGPATGPSRTTPHAEYHRQAADYFETAAGAAAGGPVWYPNAQTPVADGTGVLSGRYLPGSARESPVIRLMERGLRGDLIRQPWFENFRRRSPDPFVFISYGVAVFVTILLMLTPSAIVATLVIDALWVAVGYLYLAMATKLAHQFLEFGICLVGTVVLAAQIWTSLLAIDSVARFLPAYIEPKGLLAIKLLLDIAGAASLVYVGVQVHRGIARLTHG